MPSDVYCEKCEHDEAMCFAPHPDETTGNDQPLRCSLPSGHDGEHEAHTIGQHPITSWGDS